MEYSGSTGLFQGVEDESFIDQWMMNSYEDLSATLPMSAAAFSDDNDRLHHSMHYDDHQLPITSIPSIEDYCPNISRSPSKQLEANSWSSLRIDPIARTEPHNNPHDAAASTFFYPPSPYGQFTLNRLDHQPFWNNESAYAMESGQQAAIKLRHTSASSRVSGAKDHIIAERKRREKLSQMFIALSSIIPGLKKTDKASVLTDAVSYVKQLQNRVKTLEEQIKYKTVESVRTYKSLIDDRFIERGPYHEELPQFEARVCDRDVLIRVHCENKKGVVEKVFSEISKLNLTIGTTNVFTFGSSALDITIVAQMDLKCCTTMEELVKTLRMGFKSFM